MFMKTLANWEIITKSRTGSKKGITQIVLDISHHSLNKAGLCHITYYAGAIKDIAGICLAASFRPTINIISHLAGYKCTCLVINFVL